MSQEIKTVLSLPGQSEDIVSSVQKEIMQEELEELCSIKENDVNIGTVYVYDNGEQLEAKVYFRNGLNRKINFEHLPLILEDGEGKTLCSQFFDLKELGDIPPCAATPWKLYFNKVDLEGVNLSECKVVFGSSIKTVEYANMEYEEFPDELMRFKDSFQNFLEELPKIENGKLSMSTFNISFEASGNLIVTLVIRNSTAKDIVIEEIPLTVKNEDNNIIASGKFSLKDFTVKSMKAKICSLGFKTDFTAEKSVNMDKLYVEFI